MDVNKAAEDNVKLIDDLLKKGDKLVESFEQTIQNTHTKKDKMEQEADNVTHELNNDMNIAIQAIRDKYAKNIDIVAEKRASCAKQAIAHLGHLEMQKTTTESAMIGLQTLKQHGHATQLANMAQDITSKSEEWCHTKASEFDTNITFNIQRGEVYNDKIVFAKVDIQNLRDTTSIKRPKTIKHVKPTVVKKKKLNKIDRVWDLAVTNSNKVVAKDWNNPAYLYDKDLTLKTTFGKRCAHIATDDEEIYLTSQTDTVSIYHQDGTHSRDLKLPTLKQCRGITVNSRGELVICDWSTRVVYHVESTTGRIMAQSAVFKNPLCVAVNSKDVVIVSDNSSHSVVGITRDGTELFMYWTHGNGQNQLKWPNGLCTDTADNIIVADCSNHRVHLLGPDGKFIKYLLTESDGLLNPGAVAVDNEGQLLVGDHCGNIWVVKYTE
ncbi:unnamed protein product [Owenia fusiformis]|uniref:Uncharacterized protein n=1 Tax=Owenia fusiformis TaxID=6347 RepID=A0A8J1Y3M1_OWEFU|nr:unnamed protein product [Owenia fusiformis]